MRKLPAERRAAILSALVEGNSIAATCRMFAVNKITVLRLLADAGTVAENLHDEMVQDLTTKHVQLDELWSFVGAKNKNVRPQNWINSHGDCWTWVSMDADAKLVINWIVGGRDAGFGRPFVQDLADRLRDRVEITSDGWRVFVVLPQCRLSIVGSASVKCVGDAIEFSNEIEHLMRRASTIRSKARVGQKLHAERTKMD